MVTNLPPDALAQFRKVVASRTPEEKLQNLRIYLSMIPKHKGTAKLVVQVKRQIAKLEAEITEEKARKRRQRSISSVPEITKKKSTLVLFVVSESISKCSSFLKVLSNNPDAELYQYAYKFFDIKSYRFVGLELVIIMSDFSSLFRSEVVNLARKADIFILPTDDLETLKTGLNALSNLSSYKLFFVNDNCRVLMEEHGYGVSIMGSSKFLSEAQVRDFITNVYKFKGAKVYLSEFSTSYALRAAFERGANIKPLMVISSTDFGVSDLLEYCAPLGIIPFTFKLDLSNKGWTNDLLDSILRTIGKIRVFTKTPSGTVDQDAILLKENDTVGDLANLIHRELVKSFKCAKVFRKSIGNWIKVGMTFELKDGDIVEIRTR